MRVCTKISHIVAMSRADLDFLDLPVWKTSVLNKEKYINRCSGDDGVSVPFRGKNDGA